MTHTSRAALVLDAAAVDALLPHVDTVGAMRALFAELGRGAAIQPQQTLALFPEDRGDFITYLGASTSAGVFGAKLSPYLVKPGKPVITAWTVLMSMETGLPLMLCDAGALTTQRTAGTTALAVDHLARGNAQILAIIGSGPVARAHLQHVLPLRKWTAIRVYSPNLAADPVRLMEWTSLDPRIVVASSAEAAGADADAVLLCTSSGTPVFDTSMLTAGALVTSISTNAAQAHEVAPGFLPLTDVYCDYGSTTPSVAGDMVLATAAGWDPATIRGDLAGLATGAAPAPTGKRPVYFRSIGLGLEDIFMARALYVAADNTPQNGGN